MARGLLESSGRSPKARADRNLRICPRAWVPWFGSVYDSPGRLIKYRTTHCSCYRQNLYLQCGVAWEGGRSRVTSDLTEAKNHIKARFGILQANTLRDVNALSLVIRRLTSIQSSQTLAPQSCRALTLCSSAVLSAPLSGFSSICRTIMGESGGASVPATAAMIPPEEALRRVLSVAPRLPPVTVPLHEALGRVLAEDIRAPDPLPPYPASVKAS